MKKKYRTSFSVDAEFLEKLTRVQELIFSDSAEDLLLENIFGEALELYVEKNCPKEKQKRREARGAKKEPEIELEFAAHVSPIDNENREVVTEKVISRYIPVAVREEVLKRDEYQCSYISSSGTRCGCCRDLEIDHVVPFSLGGNSEISNLRVLCASHNLHAAKKVLGVEFIDRKIGERVGVSTTTQ